MKEKAENCNKYSETDFDDCVDREIFELFFLADEIILTVNFNLKK